MERIRKRKNQSPLSASWHRNVGIALKHCPFELAEATPQAIREWIDQMQDSGLSGLTINSKCSLLSGLVSKCMKSGLLHGMAMNPFDAADYSAGEADHIYTAVEKDYRDLSVLLPQLLDRQLIPVLIQVYCGTRISEVRKRKREDFVDVVRLVSLSGVSRGSECGNRCGESEAGCDHPGCVGGDVAGSFEELAVDDSSEVGHRFVGVVEVVSSDAPTIRVLTGFSDPLASD